MKQLHVIAGLPRAGSTLLANILATSYTVSGTSPLAAWLAEWSARLTTQDDLKSELVRDKAATEARLVQAARGMAEGWYKDSTDVVFDKSRVWNNLPDVFSSLYPAGYMLVMVRDLRDVAASIEKQHRKFPLLDLSGHATLEQRIEAQFSDEGVIGGPLRAIKGLVDRSPDNVIFVNYESLVARPEETVALLAGKLGVAVSFDPQNVPSVAPDVDGIYWNKFPHNTALSIRPADPAEWKQYLPPRIGQSIQKSYDWFYNKFGNS